MRLFYDLQTAPFHMLSISQASTYRYIILFFTPAYSACVSETLTLWSYHFPFVPISARSNSFSNASTGTSKAYTSSLEPSDYVTSSVVGWISFAPSFCASSAVPKKRFTMFWDGITMWSVIFPFFTVSVPRPSYASFT